MVVFLLQSYSHDTNAANRCQESLPLLWWARYESCLPHDSSASSWDCGSVQLHELWQVLALVKYRQNHPHISISNICASGFLLYRPCQCHNRGPESDKNKLWTHWGHVNLSTGVCCMWIWLHWNKPRCCCFGNYYINYHNTLYIIHWVVCYFHALNIFVDIKCTALLILCAYAALWWIPLIALCWHFLRFATVSADQNLGS